MPIHINNYALVYSINDSCIYDSTFHIYKGYHSYLTKEMAKYRSDEYNDIGVFEIPAGATIYVNYQYREVVSTNIEYLGKLKL